MLINLKINSDPHYRASAVKSGAVDAFLHPLFENYLGYTSGLRKLVQKVDEMFRAEGIAYAHAGGSLLGTVRQAMTLPFDTDADVQVLRIRIRAQRKKSHVLI
jgi:hypothetical protein